MRLDHQLPAYVFDTSALIDFALARSPGHAPLLHLLDPAGHHLYHPITLAELTQYYHEPLVQERFPHFSARLVSDYTRLRRNLVSLLGANRRRDDPRVYLHGRRFLPCATPFEWFSHLADQRSRPQHLRRMVNGDPTVVAPLTDHQVLAMVSWLRRCRYQAVLISGDHDQLAAAAHLTLPWIYSRDPGRTAPFPWNPF